MRLLLRLRPWLEHRHLPFALALLSVLLSAPSLDTGWAMDDYMQRQAALEAPGYMPPGLGRLDMYEMSRAGRPGTIQYFRDLGYAPWWTPEDFRLAFWRPLSAAHHYLQYRIWPDSAWPMHAVSLAWLGAATFLAALFLRRFIAVPWIAGLAGLLYAVQPGHSMTTAWIANQNALLSITFGLGAILAHDRWRRERWVPGAFLSPALLALAVFCGESGTSAGAILLSYAIFVDPAARGGRGLPYILPHFLFGLVWAAIYRHGGYSMNATEIYIDPAGDPIRYLRAAIERIPLMTLAVGLLAPATLLSFVSEWGWRMFAILGWLFIALMLVLMFPLLRRNPVSRFLLLSAFLTLLPIAATLPNDRNLMWPGIPALGLLAQWIASLAPSPAGTTPPGAPAPRILSAAAGGFLLLHLTLGPLASLGNSRGYAAFDPVLNDAYEGVLQDPAVTRQTVVFVNPPAPFMVSSFPSYRWALGQPVPRRIRMLAAGVYPLKLTRLDQYTLALRAEGGGILQRMGTWDVQGQPKDPFFNVGYLSLLMDRVFRANFRPFVEGEVGRSEGMTARVVEVAPGGFGVNEVHFTFDVPLEDPSLVWLHWRDRAYVEFHPPSLGDSVELDPIDFQKLLTG